MTLKNGWYGCAPAGSDGRREQGERNRESQQGGPCGGRALTSVPARRGCGPGNRIHKRRPGSDTSSCPDQPPKLAIAFQFPAQRFHTTVLKDHSRQNAVPDGSHRIIIPSPPTLLLQFLHQLFIGQIFDHQTQPI